MFSLCLLFQSWKLLLFWPRSKVTAYELHWKLLFLALCLRGKDLTWQFMQSVMYGVYTSFTCNSASILRLSFCLSTKLAFFLIQLSLSRFSCRETGRIPRRMWFIWIFPMKMWHEKVSDFSINLFRASAFADYFQCLALVIPFLWCATQPTKSRFILPDKSGAHRSQSDGRFDWLGSARQRCLLPLRYTGGACIMAPIYLIGDLFDNVVHYFCLNLVAVKPTLLSRDER